MDRWKLKKRLTSECEGTGVQNHVYKLVLSNANFSTEILL